MLSAPAGSVTSMISAPATLDDSFEVGWGRENMSLNTGEARDRTSLWTRKLHLGLFSVRRMISASGASKFSSFGIVAVVSEWLRVSEG